MFGYLQPFREELKMKDYKLYKSVYCGLCRSLSKSYGLKSSLTLSYDCTVLAMLYMSLHDTPCSVKKGRCTVNPLKKCMICTCEGDALRFAGAVSVIMSWHKLKDTMNDGGLFKKAAAFFLRIFLRGNYKRALRNYPLIDEYTAEMMKQQNEAEKNDVGIDRAADPTATLISRLCIMFCPEKTDRKTIGVFGYHVGRWIYLMDACDDLEKDIKKKNFNPFKKKYNGDVKATMQYCNEVLNMTAAQLVMAYELLDLHRYKAILDNIIYNGITIQQKKYTFDRYNKKKTKDIDYYPAMDVHE